MAVPNPVSGPLWTLAVKLDQPADSLQMRLYTKGEVRVMAFEIPGAYGIGWNSAVLPVEGLSHGLYYLRVKASAAGRSNEGRLVRVVYIP